MPIPDGLVVVELAPGVAVALGVVVADCPTVLPGVVTVAPDAVPL